MTITGIGFIGLRSEKYDEMARLFRDVIGLPTGVGTEEKLSVRLKDGVLLELYGPQDDFHSFFATGPVVGLQVSDFAATRARMMAADVQFIGETQHRDGISWQHFYCPDGTVAEIIGPD